MLLAQKMTVVNVTDIFFFFFFFLISSFCGKKKDLIFNRFHYVNALLLESLFALKI